MWKNLNFGGINGMDGIFLGGFHTDESEVTEEGGQGVLVHWEELAWKALVDEVGNALCGRSLIGSTRWPMWLRGPAPCGGGTTMP
jgi:hypothetical protein